MRKGGRSGDSALLVGDRSVIEFHGGNGFDLELAPECLIGGECVCIEVKWIWSVLMIMDWIGLDWITHITHTYTHNPPNKE